MRAALAWDEDTARLARQHNDANVLSLGARKLTPDQAAALVEVFCSHPVQRRRSGTCAGSGSSQTTSRPATGHDAPT